MKNSEFILKYIEQHNTSCYKVAQATGVSESTFSKWKSNPTSKVDLSIVQKIAAFFDTTVDNILETNQLQGNVSNLSTDELKLLSNYKILNELDKTRVSERAEMLAELTAERAAQEAEKEKTVAIQITPTADEMPEQDEEEKLIEIRHSVYKVSAGHGFDLDEGDSWETIDIPDTPEARRADYALTIIGDSMEPVYYDGDIVLVRKQPAVDIGQIGIFILDGSGYIKKFCGDHLVSMNEDYDDIPLSDYEDVRCSGRVIGRV